MESNGPPHAPESEAWVIGSVLLDEATYLKIMGYLDPQDFYTPFGKKTWETILSLRAAGMSVDLATVGQSLLALPAPHGQKMFDRLAEVMDKVPTAANIRAHARIVKEQAVLRRLSSLGQKLAERVAATASEPDAAEMIIKSASRVLHGLAQSLSGKRAKNLTKIGSILKSYTKDVEERSQTKRGHYIATGYADIDRYYGGLRKGGLCVVAGRPGTGKTSFALNIIENLLNCADQDLFGDRRKIVIAMFSMEQSAQELAERIVAAVGRIDSSRLGRGALEPKEWTKFVSVCGSLYEADFYVDDTARLTPAEAEIKLRTLASAAGGVDLIVIDYVQLMSAGRRMENRNLEIGEITRSLKTLAQDFGAPVLLLSQLSRQVEGRGDKRPILADLRESGAIEQDADQVWMLYRPDGDSGASVAELLIRKNRHGQRGTVKLTFLGDYMRFQPCADI